MFYKNRSTWLTAFCVAAASTCLGMYLHPAKLGMYLQMPGIAVGLFAGWFLNSDSVAITNVLVWGITVGINACFYRVLIRLAAFLAGRYKTALGR